MPPLGTPVPEFEIDEVLVSKLLADQHADLAHLPIRSIDAGWDNAMFCLGEHLAVRLPRRALAAALIVHEQRWLLGLADCLSLPVPKPYRIGAPACGYPWSWSVVQWLDGETADGCEPQSTEGKRWGAFLRSLHTPPPDDAPTNPVRGVALSQRALAIEERMDRLSASTNLISDQVRHLWHEALGADIDMPPTWIHGDLHPRNVLVQGGFITGVIDWGDVASGDPSTDLASIWMLFSEPQTWQEALKSYLPISDATMHRALGWAVVFGTVLLDSGLVDNPRNAALGERILRQVASTVDQS